MIKKITCIECPKGCMLSVDMENCKVVKVKGNECPKGEAYAISEVEDPVRVLTSAVLARGLAMKMVPVRTDKPVPKTKMLEAIGEIKKIKIDKPLRAGDIIVKNFMKLGVDLIATREVL